MINSPSLPLTSPAPAKPSRSSAMTDRSSGSMSFSNHMERAARADDSSTRPTPREAGRKDQVTRETDHDRSQVASSESKSTEQAEAKSTEQTKTNDAKQESSPNATSTAKAESDKAEALEKDGKKLQSGGQQVAESETTPVANNAEGTPSQVSEETNAKTGAASEDGALDGDTTQTADETAGKVAESDGAFVQSEPVNNSERLTQSSEGTSVPGNVEESALSNDDVMDEQKTHSIPLGVSAEDTAKLTDHQAQMVPQSGEETLTKEEAALSRITAPVIASEGEAKAQLTAEGSKEAQTNLRWVMDQLTPKGEKQNLAQTFAQANVSAEGVIKADAMALVKEAAVATDAILLTQEGGELNTSKKSLEQLMTSLGGQVNSGMSTPSNSLTAAASTAQAVPPRAEGNTPQMTMQTLPNSAAWGAEMTTKVSWVAKEGFKTAHIHLDPPELGSLTVKVSMDQDANTQVSFIASSAQAKDVLESQMQRLREMLQQQGVEVDKVDVEVSQGNDQSANQGQLNSEAENGQGGLAGGGQDGDEQEDSLENVTHVATSEQSIDFYA